MFKTNPRKEQPYLISHVQELPAKQLQRLEKSWSGVFFREFFSRIDEQAFAVLYADLPSRPNAPINELVSLEFLKDGIGWTDEEMYEHYLFDLQTRPALGLDQLGEEHLELRTVYNFRERLSRYMQEQGINLLDKAFEQVTDQQIAAFQLKTGCQRMDTVMLGANIRQRGRLQLLVEVLQRVERMLNAEDKLRYAELFAAYLQGHSGHYIYRLKREDYPEHFQRIGEHMQRLLEELRPTYGKEAAYALLERVFGEHFRVEALAVNAKANQELSARSLQSPDDLEATYRVKRGRAYQGYTSNLSETCDPSNPLQLITKTQTAPNSTDEDQLLAEALPNLKTRTGVSQVYTDGGYGGQASAPVLQEQQVALIQTAIRGRPAKPTHLPLDNFEIQLVEGKPTQITCPSGQKVRVQPTCQKKAFVASFDPSVCATCAFFEKNQCPLDPGKRDGRPRLRFTHNQAQAAARRRRSRAEQKAGGNRRAAVEATVRSVKHPFPAGKLPVRGLFRVACMVMGSAAVTNVRRIQRFLAAKQKQISTPTTAPEEQNGARSIGLYLCFPVFWPFWPRSACPLTLITLSRC